MAHSFGTVFSHVCDLHAKTYFYRYIPKTSLSSPPWPEVVLPDPVEEARHHAGKRGAEARGVGWPPSYGTRASCF